MADDLLAHLRRTNSNVRFLSGLPVSEIEDLTPERAQRESEYHRAALARLEKLNIENLPHEHWLVAKLLWHTFKTGSQADQDYWFDFVVTPYRGGSRVNVIHRVLEGQALSSAAERDNYLHLLDEYVAMLEQMAAKTRAQAGRGIRVPKPALAGARATISGLRASAPAALDALPARLEAMTQDEAAAFRTAIANHVKERVTPAYNRLLAVFDDAYITAAPATVGLSQYPGGKENYLRRITYDTGLTLTPREIHDRGLAAVADLDSRMQAIRDELGFKGDREAFHEILRKDARFVAKSPEEVEQRYLRYIARIEPQMPNYFSRLPQAPYGVKRLDPAAEPGMTYGYYERPTPSRPSGTYRYNGSNLAQRPLVWAGPLIYHELIPGHHLQFALETENENVHPVREFLFFGAFNEGWAEYAASLANEMGVLDDPYDRYGQLLSQTFLATRLVVDTGMNYFGWPLERARQYMRDHTFQSDVEIASESLRYSTDLFAQALGYRLGFEQFWALRRRAEAQLGDRFDIREFHATVVGNGAMPLHVLEEHVERYIQASGGRTR